MLNSDLVIGRDEATEHIVYRVITYSSDQLHVLLPSHQIDQALALQGPKAMHRLIHDSKIILMVFFPWFLKVI